MERPFILIGNTESNRTKGFQAARARLGLSPAVIVPYLDILEQRVDWTTLLAGKRPIIRLESPGGSFLVERALIARGAAFWQWDRPVTPDVAIEEAQAGLLTPEKGRIFYPRQWYLGYRSLLEEIEREVEAACPEARWMNIPHEIAIMFDKRECHHLLSEAGVPVPRLPAPVGTINSYEELKIAMQQSRMYRVFAKLATGSAASGVIAYQMNPRTGAELADTTIELVERGAERFFYNSTKLRRYTNPAGIAQMIDWLGTQGLHVEQWMEKASTPDGHVFDIRQIAINHEPCHRVARLSRTPITNLHLQNQRASLEEMQLSQEAITQLEACARQTAACFPRSFVAGIDILLRKGSYLPYVVDINPFGDLLYHVSHGGWSPYEWALICLEKDEAECSI